MPTIPKLLLTTAGQQNQHYTHCSSRHHTYRQLYYIHPCISKPPISK
jgi:hypothetical protein